MTNFNCVDGTGRDKMHDGKFFQFNENEKSRRVVGLSFPAIQILFSLGWCGIVVGLLGNNKSTGRHNQFMQIEARLLWSAGI